MFALICTDKPGGLDVRKENRAKHLDYIAETGVVVQAGPFLSGEGEMSGSLVILDLDDRHEAEAWAKADPYAVAGLFAEVRIEEWKKVVG